MIIGIGLDSVEIERFTLWPYKNQQILAKVYTQKEITYCLKNPAKSVERFAVRFACKEAFFKALQPLAAKKIPLFILCKAVEISNEEFSPPKLTVSWKLLTPYIKKTPAFEDLIIWTSLTHTSKSAAAVVILEQCEK